MTQNSPAKHVASPVADLSTGRTPYDKLVKYLIESLDMKDKTALLKWLGGPEIQTHWEPIEESVLNHRAHTTDMPDPADFLDVFSDAVNNDSINQKYRSKSFDTTDCTQVDRMVKFSIDALGYAQDNGGKLKGIKDDLDVTELGTLMYMIIDFLLRPDNPQSA